MVTLSWETSFLSRSCIKACLMSVFAFIIFEMWMYYEKELFKNEICITESLSSFVPTLELVSAVVFLSKSIGLIIRVFGMRSSRSDSSFLRIMVAFTLTITTLAGISSLLTASLHWGGVCDTFGVRVPATRFGEWIACVPLLIFIVLGCDGRQKLERRDILILILISSCMLLFFLLHFRISFAVEIFLLGSCFITAAICARLFVGPFLNNFNLHVDDYDIIHNSEKPILYHTRKDLTLVIIWTFPLFPAIFLLSLFRLIDDDVAEILFLIANLLAKFYFISSAMETTVEALNSSFLASVMNARNRFIRYILHEVRVPLNSITLGLDVALSQQRHDHHPHQQQQRLAQPTYNRERRIRYTMDTDDNDIEPGQEEGFQNTLREVTQASNSIGNVLKDITTFQMYEEGSIRLVHSHFRIAALLNQILPALQRTFEHKKVQVNVHISPSVPEYLIGDSERIALVLRKILENAVFHSPKDGVVEVFVDSTGKERDNSLGVASPVISPLQQSSLPKHRVTTSITNRTNVAQFSLRKAPMFTSFRLKPSGVNQTVHLAIRIQDAGPGISPSDQERLFVPYQRLRSGDAMTGGGSGLSLALSKYIIERHGGALTCESALGQGSTFIISLCLRSGLESDMEDTTRNISHRDNKVHVLLEETPKAPAIPPTFLQQFSSPGSSSLEDLELEFSPNRGKLIDTVLPAKTGPYPSIENTTEELPFCGLIVEDVTICRKLLKNILHRIGITCDEAVNGAEAVAMVKNDIEKYAFIFMDNTMPIMSGIVATQTLRELGYQGFIIGLTANAMDNELSEFLHAGLDAVFTKPMESNTLELLIRYIKRRRKKSVEYRKFRVFNGRVEEYFS